MQIRRLHVCVAAAAMSSNRASRPSQPPPPFVVAIGAHVSSAEHAQLLLRAAESVRLFHPEAKLVVVDNGSPRYFVAPEGAEVVRHSHSRWAFGAINASLSIALASAARCYTYLQHSMELLRPLPLAGLSCNVVAFRTFEADNWGYCRQLNRTAAPASYRAKRCHLRTCCEYDSAGRLSGHQYQWAVRRAKAFDSESAVGHTGHIFAHGFVSCDHAALAQLQASLVGVQPISSKGEDEASERLLGVFASAKLDSDPINCRLDGDYQSGPPRFVGKISQGDHKVAWLSKKRNQREQAQAWVWHAELSPYFRRGGVRLEFMYEPIRASVVAGLKSHTLAHRWNVSSHVVADAQFFGAAMNSEDRRILERRLQSLRRGDLFVWIGEARESAVPVEMLRNRGVRTVYYQTEPVRSCWIQPLTRRRGIDRFDEVWDYSWRNLDICKHAMAKSHIPEDGNTTFRYVPPVALPGRVSANQQSEETRLLFLGSARHRTGCSQPKMGPGQKQVGCSQSCVGALNASVAAGWLRIESNAWNPTQLRTVLLSHGIYVSVHKACATTSNPVPPRVAMLLNAKALVISEHSSARDEAQFEGMVSFVPFANLEQEFSRLRLLSRDERQQLAESRAKRFAERFAPWRVYHEAGVHALLNQLDKQHTS